MVDDEPSILMTLELVLRGEGFDVHTASSSHEAKAAIAQDVFDLVLTDVSLETSTAGYEVVRAAKTKHGSSKPATLVTSGFPDLLFQWESEGADAGLQKPTEIPELLATINRLVPER